MAPSRIRAGLIIDGTQAPAWVERALKLIHANGDTDVVLVIQAAHPPPPQTPGLLRKALDHYYQRVIERGGFENDPDEIRSITGLLQGVPTLRAQGDSTTPFASLCANQLTAHALDVIINFSKHAAPAPFAGAARNGVWSLHFSDTLTHQGTPPGFWESMANWRESGSALTASVCGSETTELTLCRSYSTPNWMSIRGNKSNYYWKTAGFVARKLRELRQSGAEAFMLRARKQNTAPVFYSHPKRTFPSVAHYAALLGRKTAQKIRLIHRNRTTFDQWMLLFDIHEELSTDLSRYRRITPPPDRFWADPHVIKRGDDYYIFIEELLYSRNLGHISFIKMNAVGEYTQPQTIIERPYHLSYPFVFEFEGALYMIPESAQNSTIELYRCTEFPGKWVFEKNLMEGVKAYDSTLIFNDGKWWLFASIAEHPNTMSSDELFLFWSDSPLSDRWTPHPHNPIISDCKQARPAGRIFERNGQLYRPSQNCSIKYGYGFNIARIDTLNETKYQETLMSRIEPRWAPDLVSTHTYASEGALQVIDAELRRSRR